MGNRKNRKIHGIALCVLLAEFLLCRYGLLEIHKMQEWPEVLFVAGLLVLAVSFAAKATLLPIATAAAYLIGFGAGVLFQKDWTDPIRGRTNNLWIIWTVTFAGIILLSALAERICAKRKQQRR